MTSNRISSNLLYRCFLVLIFLIFEIFLVFLDWNKINQNWWIWVIIIITTLIFGLLFNFFDFYVSQKLKNKKNSKLAAKWFTKKLISYNFYQNKYYLNNQNNQFLIKNCGFTNFLNILFYYSWIAGSFVLFHYRSSYPVIFILFVSLVTSIMMAKTTFSFKFGNDYFLSNNPAYQNILKKIKLEKTSEQIETTDCWINYPLRFLFIILIGMLSLITLAYLIMGMINICKNPMLIATPGSDQSMLFLFAGKAWINGVVLLVIGLIACAWAISLLIFIIIPTTLLQLKKQQFLLYNILTLNFITIILMLFRFKFKKY